MWVENLTYHNAISSYENNGLKSTKEWKIIKNAKRCRNGTQTRKDKSDGNYTKPVPTSFNYSFVKRYRDWWGFVYSLSLLSSLVCVLFGTPFLHLMIFLSCFCTFLLIFSLTLWSKQYFNQVQPQPWNSTASWVIVQPSMQPHTGSLDPDLLLLTMQV